jgi:hypothetical protein
MRDFLGLRSVQPSDVQPDLHRPARLAALEPLATRQSGVLARRQLTALGWTDGQVDHEIDYGRWHVPARGVVALQNSTLDDTQRLWLGIVYAGPDARLSHLTGARAAGLRWTGGDQIIDVLTAKGDLVPPLAGFTFHQTRRPYQRWVSPTAVGPPRLPLEHCALLAAERDHSLRRAIGLLAACVQQRLTTPDRLQHTIPQLRKLRHKQHFSLALGDIAGGAESFAEIDVARLCTAAGLAAPARQRVRLDKEGRRRFLDCEWIRRDGSVVVLEIDGSFHLEVGNWWRDMRRERAVVLSNGTVLRCSTVELRLDPGDILGDLMKAGVPRA